MPNRNVKALPPRVKKFPNRPEKGSSFLKTTDYLKRWNKSVGFKDAIEHASNHHKAVVELERDVVVLERKKARSLEEDRRLAFLKDELDSLKAEKETVHVPQAFFERKFLPGQDHSSMVPNKDLIERTLLSIHYRDKPLLREIKPFERERVWSSVRLFWNPKTELRVKGIESLTSLAIEDKMLRRFMPLVFPMVLSKNKVVSKTALQEMGRYLLEVNKEDSKPGTRVTFTREPDPVLNALHQFAQRLKDPIQRLEAVEIVYHLGDTMMSFGAMSQQIVSEKSPKVVKGISRYLIDLCGDSGRNSVITAARTNRSKPIRELLRTILDESRKS